MMKLVSGGSVINGATTSSWHTAYFSKPPPVKASEFCHTNTFE